MGSVVIVLLIIGAALLAIRQMIKDKRNGKSISCGGDCSRCGGCRHDEGGSYGNGDETRR